MSEMTEQQVDAAVTRALERKPVVALPAGFAAKVAANLPVTQRHVLVAVVRRRMSVGKAVAMVAAVVLVAVLFVLAPRVGTNFASLGFALEMLLVVQLAAIAYGLMQMPGGEF